MKAVYSHYSKDGTLLYVGASTRPFQRLDSHRYSPWATEIHTVKLQWFESEGEMWAAEIKTIEEGVPLYNRVAVNGDVCKERISLKGVTPKTLGGEILKEILFSNSGLSVLQVRSRIGCSKNDVFGFVDGSREPSDKVAIRAWRNACIRIPKNAWSEKPKGDTE